MTRLAQLELTVRAISSHALVVTAWQRSGVQMPSAVLESSEALFLAALAFATEPEPPDPPAGPCAHPPEARINFGAAGCSDFQCRVCGESVAVPITATTT